MTDNGVFGVFSVFLFYKRDLWLMFSPYVICLISLWADFY